MQLIPKNVGSTSRDETQQILHSDDAFAPVAYLNLTNLHLDAKNQVQNSRYFIPIGNKI